MVEFETLLNKKIGYHERLGLFMVTIKSIIGF